MSWVGGQNGVVQQLSKSGVPSFEDRTMCVRAFSKFVDYHLDLKLIFQKVLIHVDNTVKISYDYNKNFINSENFRKYFILGQSLIPRLKGDDIFLNDLIITKSTWKRFVDEGILDTSRLSNRIIESWYRSKKNNVNPYLEKGSHLLSYEDLLKKRKENNRLLQLASPYIHSLDGFLKGTGTILILTDSEGHVLKGHGEDKTIQFARDFNIINGQWNEKELGTNAIGTALEINEPIHVAGVEHFSAAFHNWTCSAAPIKNNQGQLVGVLAISTTRKQHDLKLLSIAVSTAYAIELQWKLHQENERLELLQASYNKIESNREQSIIICDRDDYFIAASSSIMDMIKDEMKEYKTNVSKLEEIGLKEKIRIPIHMDGKLYGYEIHVAIKKDHKMQAHNGSTFKFAGEEGKSEQFEQVINDLKKASKTDITVYIHGESGTGKEITAKTIHLNSKRKNKPFIVINCGSIPEHLLESELFGYEEGAFTGARKKGHKGKFEQADGGTIFLDEIGDMPLSMQVALLRVLQEKEVVPIGGSKARVVDVRIITATNKRLEMLVEEGKFRRDLFYRLNVFNINLPPLRERKADISSLVDHFLKTKDWDVKFSDYLMDYLVNYHWPGNVRELFNVLEKMKVLAEDGEPQLSHFSPYFLHGNLLTNSISLKNYKNNVKDKMVMALEQAEGNVSKAAEFIGMPMSTFYRKLQKYKISR
ncbi:sigma-54-dependent Fis family transcriptional regulator [Peribacillus cavernae]|uniref:Sigma-54-dependent Fis family transcriptional regulator n=1 Tax=Peribacillus cavernae TaxID=1674310 RepID=A0A3S0VY05_9BACI|nr:sigma-54-dependent Fis family transcriptional regulator [Peribacillus cavernae]MDQ0219138.1 transcriptional regulator of acetoin/glycerol metabolism [Peribacillus cavernae]RUQ28632.1 sigma-54-dependent Fis family transcriptional regulator [Peribacillus cavernae]